MDHADLVSEMPQVERLLTQDRLQLARMRRVQQLKVAKQREKEWQKSQGGKKGGTNSSEKRGTSGKKHILFQDSVVLLEAAARNDINEVARLLQKGVSPDATNDDGLTALHQCCIDNNPDMLKLLLDYGANVNAEDSERWTPLHAAATCGHIYLVKLLISRGANLLAVNADGNMPYDLCDNEETLDYIEAEMSQRGVTQDLIDETRESTELKMLYDLQAIAGRGGDLEVEDQQGATPLHIGAANGYSRVVEFLLENNVFVDAVDNDLWTPVHAAACWGHLEVLEKLVQSGADLNAKNKNEETPADICEDPEIREKIEELRTEQESKRLAEAKGRVRRTQSNNTNTRAQSVRRTSIRDKTLTTKKDAVEETKLRLIAQEGYTTADGNNTTEPNSISSESNQNVVDGQSATNTTSRKSSNTTPNNIAAANVPISNTTNNNNNNNNNNINNNNNSVNNNSNHKTSNFVNNNHITNSNNSSNNNNNNNSFHQNQNPLYNNHNHYDGINRSSPEGKDNDSYVAEENSNKKLVPIGNSMSNNTIIHKNGGSDLQTGIFQATQENGKINVQVTVLVDTQTMDHSIAGTLADLKKHRAQTRSSNSPENGSIITAPIELSVVSSPELQSPAIQMPKFTGITGDVVSDSTRSRKCCALM